MLVKTYCAAVNGLEVTTVTVEVSLNRGVMYHLTGLGDEAVKESRNRISAALQYSGFKFPIADITINLAPADLRKEGSSFDLPLAIGLLGANNNIPEDIQCCILFCICHRIRTSLFRRFCLCRNC